MHRILDHPPLITAGRKPRRLQVSGLPPFLETFMETKPSACAGCGVQLPARKPRQGQPRKWCSQACRLKAYRREHGRETYQAYLAACREASAARVRRCPTCGTEMAPGLAYCSAACRPVKTAACAQCGSEFKVRQSVSKYCSLSCSNRARAAAPEVAKALELERWQRKNRRRRAAKRGGISEPYSLAEIAARDRFRCGLCGKRVAMKQFVPHPKAPTIDHVIPVSEGGDDTRANVQLAHFLCNSLKGARGSQQLALVG